MAQAHDQAGNGAGGVTAAREADRRAIDMWAPIVPVPEVMDHVAKHFPKEMAGYLRVFYKRDPDPAEFEHAAALMRMSDADVIAGLGAAGIDKTLITGFDEWSSVNETFIPNEIVATVATQGIDDGFDALQGRYGDLVELGIIDPLRVCRAALQNGASVAGLLLTTNTLIAEEQTPWGGSRALMTEFGQLDEGLHQPSPDASTPQSLGLGPSVG